MSALDDPGVIRDIIVNSLDNEFHDAADIFITAKTGGTGSTSASATLVVTDAEDSSKKQIFYVTVTLPDEDTE